VAATVRRRFPVAALLLCLALIGGCTAVRDSFDATMRIQSLGCADVQLSINQSLTDGDEGMSVTVRCTSGLRERVQVEGLQLAVLRAVWEELSGPLTRLTADVRTQEVEQAPPLVLDGREAIVERLGERDPALDERDPTDVPGAVVAAGLTLVAVLVLGVVVLVVFLVLRSRRPAAPQGWAPPPTWVPPAPQSQPPPPPPLPPGAPDDPWRRPG
jgi:hypothetical protein